ncbi:hypothetical protein GPECTOR_43g951 [Gonium pectorale]|uniref:Protein HGH1 N-terminal domain-containing protein n=1 Tax=Gonium pectorale TaxID=33097 RepID=A0A150G9J1_GONPE|nr:hypothetical protein GPECTOR_43g951 [Gonium pectorale]|eukprot:KXZ46514.1 hypothetical protein GPECTOR_43g951 [Gonium pectorale]
MASELEELVGFLDDDRAEVRAASAEIVAGLTASAEGIEKLKAVQRPLVIKLFRSVGRGGDAARKSLVALVNLSHDPAVVEVLLSLNVVNRVMEFLRDGSIPHVDLLTGLLANVTISERGCRDLLQIGQGNMEGLHMAVLLKKFVVGGITLSPGEPDPFEHVASVLTNVTRLAEGRRLLLQPGRGLLAALVSQLQSWNSLRRLGASGAIKNCVMSAEEDGTLDSILDDKTALQHMLRPINGQPPLEKEDTVRECMAEAVLVLARTDKGRDVLWEAGAPEALRKGYEDEQHPGVCLAMERTAEIFLSHSTIDSGMTPGIAGLASSSAAAQRQQGQEPEGQQQQGQ